MREVTTMLLRTPSARLGSVLALCGCLAAPALATDANRQPDVGEAITAKITGEKCRGALTALELAELELHLARSWVREARMLNDADARRTIELYKSAESTIAGGWSHKDCTLEAVEKARQVAARIRASGPSVAR
jgi:hypothetical protein